MRQLSGSIHRAAIWRRLASTAVIAALWLSIAASADEPISLSLPIACEVGKTCFIQSYVDDDPSPGAQDYNCGDRTYDTHDGIDFRLPSMAVQHAGVDVLAASAGTVLRVRDNVRDRSVREAGRESVRGRECGNGVVLEHKDGWITQYCHMAQGSIRVKPGQSVDIGAPLGRVGLSGATEFPHLHFAVRLRDKKIDPFAYGLAEGTCKGGTSLWNPALQAELSYREREVINIGLAAEPPTMEQVEAGELKPPRTDSSLVAYARAIGLKAGDELGLQIIAPDGSVLFQKRHEPLDRAKAQFFALGGRKAGAKPWPSGNYTINFDVLNQGKPVLKSTFAFALSPS